MKLTFSKKALANVMKTNRAHAMNSTTVHPHEPHLIIFSITPNKILIPNLFLILIASRQIAPIFLRMNPARAYCIFLLINQKSPMDAILNVAPVYL